MYLVPDSDSAPEPVNADVLEKAEIHSAKAHRCVDKVRAKGHPESNAWAICTASIGKAGVYAKGHGGRAKAKRKVHESSPNDGVVALLREFNQCHAPDSGRFCSGGARGARASGNGALKAG